MNDELMTPDDVCDLLKVTKDWLYDQVQARRIPHIRLGRHLRFRHAEMLAHIAANSVSEEGGEVSPVAEGCGNVARTTRRDVVPVGGDGRARQG